jgi:glutamate carboxypeptidase
VARAFVELAQHTTVPGTSVSVEGTFGCAPMPKTRATELLVSLAQQCARGLGFGLDDTATGGVSDANVIAGLGVPVLDGLGPIGGLDHSPNEYIDGDSIVPRTLLLADLIRLVVGERERLRSLRETRR